MSGWKAEDLNSFWSHYNLVQDWVKLSENACEAAINDFEWKQAEEEVYSMLKLPKRSSAIIIEATLSGNENDVEMMDEQSTANEKENEEEEAMDELSPEMIEFYKQTLKHREERDKFRKLEEEENRKKHESAGGSWLSKDDEEYILASEVGINGVQRQTVDAPRTQAENEEFKKNMRLMYGTAADKMIAMEFSMNFKFNQHMSKHNPSLWPNIPLRF